MRGAAWLLVVPVVILLSACGGGSRPAAPGDNTEGPKITIGLSSSAFADGGAIPTRYTCDGVDISPPLQWSSVPERTRSLALVVDDPDAPGGTFVHWLIYDLPPDTRRLPEDVPERQTLPSGAAQGVNGAGGVGYMGPCPPSGTHRYFFRVYALDTELDLAGGATWEGLASVMKEHILAVGRLIGTYRRR